MTVDNLKKVTLAIASSLTPNFEEEKVHYSEVTFIFGLGNAGLTPFEYELADKEVGDELLIQVKRPAAFGMFEHLTMSILHGIPYEDSFYLRLTILDVSLPDSREIIKALAEKSDCGSDCDCGCGCG
ncbi:hypothetical protein ACFL9U_11740 [Thermodesulfobacteriota bacterium]